MENRRDETSVSESRPKNTGRSQSLRSPDVYEVQPFITFFFLCYVKTKTIARGNGYLDGTHSKASRRTGLKRKVSRLRD